MQQKVQIQKLLKEVDYISELYYSNLKTKSLLILYL